jgi:hypothetical protein
MTTGDGHAARARTPTVIKVVLMDCVLCNRIDLRVNLTKFGNLSDSTNWFLLSFNCGTHVFKIPISQFCVTSTQVFCSFPKLPSSKTVKKFFLKARN